MKLVLYNFHVVRYMFVCQTKFDKSFSRINTYSSIIIIIDAKRAKPQRDLQYLENCNILLFFFQYWNIGLPRRLAVPTAKSPVLSPLPTF